MATNEQTISIKVNVDFSDAIKQVALLLKHLIAVQERRDDLTEITITSETVVEIAEDE